ncbi:MAG TPA: SDR family oxidoreductase [Dehalococcoidia bacterium]|nr:SDR family oxidoreductase [Dehalococcoidia bacterium]
MTEAASRPRALITGASGGIGGAFARQLAKRGHDLVLVARRRDRMEKLATELADAHGVEVEVVEADLAKDGDVSSVEERVRRGDIDLLVNDAGFGTRGEFVGLPLARELEELDVNVRALMRLTHAALGPMVERGRGGVINVASTGAFQPVPHMATYAATKAFVLHFSEALHEEVKGKGVTVTCLCPGPVKTEFQEVAGVNDRSVPSMAWKSTDDVVESALKAVSARRAITVPGALNRATATAVKLMPRFVARRVAGSMFKRER